MFEYICVAHLPFAHHKLQGLRSDARPTPIKLLTSITNANLFEISFNDVVRGKPRESVASFIPPCTYHFRVKNPLTGSYRIGLILFCVPLGSGRARAIVNAKISSPKKNKQQSTTAAGTGASVTTASVDRVTAAAPSTPAVIAKNGSSSSSLFRRILAIFQWFLHISVNKFLDSDIWVHEQELAARKTSADVENDSSEMTSGDGTAASVTGSSSRIRTLAPVEMTEDASTAKALGLKYVLVSQQSDNGVKEWRNWWKATGLSKSSIFGPASHLIRTPIAKQIDRYQGHVRYCKICQNALKNIQFIKKWSLLVALLPIILTTSITSRIIGIVGYMVLNHVTHNLEADMMGGVYLQGKKVSAAQLAPFGMS